MKKIDIHAHVLPGIDDGAKNWDTCLTMLLESSKCGVDAIIATPHYLPWQHSASPNTICKLCKEAKQKLFEKHGITMDIYPGNEIYYNVDTIRNLKERKVLTLAESRYVLLEFSVGEAYRTLYRATRDLLYEGFVPILAHVERYGCLREAGRLKELKEMGTLIQVNIDTLQGGIFDSDTRWAKRCLLDEKVDFLSSDMHGLKERTPMKKEELYWIQKKLGSSYQKELLYENAQKIIGNESI